LDNFDIHKQGTLERDIKYLTKYENFFKLDENSKTFKLECEYKIPFFSKNKEIHSKWNKQSVSLNQINFDNENYQIYFYNYGEQKTNLESEQKKIIEKQRQIDAEKESKNIINEIKKLRKRKTVDFSSASMKIENLSKYELQTLNSRLDFTNISPVIHWITTATQDDFPFIEFILNCTKIELDVNQTSKEGRTALQAIYENNEISNNIPIKALFKRGYRLTDNDKKLISKIDGDSENKLIIYTLCNNLKNRSLVDSVFKYSKLIFIIESAKKNKIIGFNYKKNAWIAFANNAINFYQEYWEYIELAFKGFGLWDILTESDKKKSFAKKLQAFYSEMPTQKYDFDEVFRELYPELKN